LHQIDTFYNALTQSNQDSLNAAAGGNLLNRTPRDALTIIENKSKVRTSRNKLIVSKKKLSHPVLTPTRMTLKLATRSIAYPTGIAEDVFVQVGKFTFPDDFVVINYDVDPRVPFILGRPFLRTACTLVDGLS
nr:reverse transcriptase domain-containing protein [Tanacetum cinerariifolium]